MGTSISDHPQLLELGGELNRRGFGFSPSSIRADRVTPELAEALAQAGLKTVALAPEVGSPRMQRVIHKGLDEQVVTTAAARLAAAGILNLRLYYMVGLPTETEEDVEAIITLTKNVRAAWLEASRTRRRLGHITLSVNPFIPKPGTPFQWAAMEKAASLRRTLRRLRREVGPIPNVTFQAESITAACWQALLSRADRRVGEALVRQAERGAGWREALNNSGLDLDFYLYRTRGEEETFPWDFIRRPVPRGRLWREWRAAREEER